MKFTSALVRPFFASAIFAACSFASIASTPQTALASHLPPISHNPPMPVLKPFSYRVKVPATDLSCAEHANQVAAQFAVAPRAARATGTCEGTQTLSDQGNAYTIDVLVIHYLAESEQTPDQSVFGGDSSVDHKGHADAGVFKTYADCLSELTAQTPVFVGETGLQPLVAYCGASTQTEFYPGFTLTFESMGARKHRLYTFSEDGMGIYNTDRSMIVDAALTAVQTAGGHVV